MGGKSTFLHGQGQASPKRKLTIPVAGQSDGYTQSTKPNMDHLLHVIGGPAEPLASSSYGSSGRKGSPDLSRWLRATDRARRQLL